MRRRPSRSCARRPRPTTVQFVYSPILPAPTKRCTNRKPRCSSTSGTRLRPVSGAMRPMRPSSVSRSRRSRRSTRRRVTTRRQPPRTSSWSGFGAGPTPSCRRASWRGESELRVTRLSARTGSSNSVGDVLLELREVLPEHPGKLLGLLIVGVLVRPRVARIEDIVRHTSNVLRHLEPEDRILVECRRVQIAAQEGVHHRARVRELHPLANPECTTGPTGVDEPHVRHVL